MSLKIELIEMPEIDSVSSIIGEKMYESIDEVLSLHDELKNIVGTYMALKKQRNEAAEAADEYLKSNLQGISPERNRVFVVRGIEAEMQVLVERGLQIKHTLEMNITV